LIGWFGLQRDLCDIILSQCPSISLYFNNQFKCESRPSTDDLLIDMTTKNLEATNMNNDTHRAPQYHFISLSEPD
jgi:hypothetical protein